MVQPKPKHIKFWDGNMNYLNFIYLIFFTQVSCKLFNFRKRGIQLKLTRENCKGNKHYIITYTDFNFVYGRDRNAYINYLLEVSEDVPEKDVISVSFHGKFFTFF